MKYQDTSVQKKKKQVRKSRPDPDQMDRLLERCGIHLNAMQLRQLWTYHQLLRRFDTELNLTRIRNFENMVVKLYADSILPALQTSLPSPLLDLGTGPGMPGIPLKIFRPDLHILLAESRQNRVDFLKNAVSTLGIPGLEVVERGIAADYSRPVAGVITRAVEPMAQTLARVAGCLERKGTVIFMKGPQCEEEMKKAATNFTSIYKLMEDIHYNIPNTINRRRLVIFQRNINPVKANGRLSERKMSQIKVIQSENNTIYKDLKKLFSGRGVKKQGKTLVCGARQVAEGIDKWPQRCLAWISNGDRTPPPPEASDDLAWFQLAPELFGTLDAFKTKHPILLFKAPKPQRWQPESCILPGCSPLIPFQDPENVGAVIRSAVAFNVNRIILLAESANPFHPKAVRASAGTVFSASLYDGPPLSEIPTNLPVISLATKGKPLDHISFPRSFFLLAGMEGSGLPSKWNADSVSIPMNPEVESLNAATATAIALYSWKIGSQTNQAASRNS